MGDFYKVRSKSTGHIVWVRCSEFMFGKHTSKMIWGQVSPFDESGWYFNADDLERVTG
jgi:hypothetical protein